MESSPIRAFRSEVDGEVERGNFNMFRLILTCFILDVAESLFQQ